MCIQITPTYVILKSKINLIMIKNHAMTAHARRGGGGGRGVEV
jgi:hypothetical protein